ncbi:hypothetical protein [Candidatus Regiella endosymbiont of Tuberolachnus salignus]|uniref:hypothetical protein n=1 Tax=Candidatus Regiella endosymbiont of Tuberolachnus salignus TaxID=3077956 RepID=UPI0030D3D8CD
MRKAAVCNTEYNFTLFYLQRQALIHRLNTTGKPIPNAILSHHQTKTNHSGRTSIACKVAIISLYKKIQGDISANYTQAANILSAYATEAGYHHKFNKDILKRWCEEIKMMKKRTK